MTTNNFSFNRDRDLVLAIQHHLEGRYDEAERIYPPGIKVGVA